MRTSVSMFLFWDRVGCWIYDASVKYGTAESRAKVYLLLHVVENAWFPYDVDVTGFKLHIIQLLEGRQNMNSLKIAGQVGKSMSLDEEILKAAEKLKGLQEKQKKKNRKDQERTQKAISDLIRREKLDTISVNLWEAALPEIKKLLRLEQPKAIADSKPQTTAVT